MTTKAWLDQVTKFSVLLFSFKRYRYMSNNKHSQIFVRGCKLDHFSLASLYRLHWTRHKIPPGETQQQYWPGERTMVNLALAHPESAQCIDFHQPVPSLSTLSTVVPAKKVFSYVLWQPLKDLCCHCMMYEKISVVTEVVRGGDKSSRCLSVVSAVPEGCCLTSFCSLCIVSLDSTNPHDNLHALLFTSEGFASVPPADTILFLD